MQQFKPPPDKKPPGMSHKAWLEHLEELEAFEKRNYRLSRGRLVARPSRGVPTEDAS